VQLGRTEELHALNLYEHAAATDAHRQIPLARTRLRNEKIKVGWEEGVVSCSN
jgi:hypothetical protein